MGRHIHPRNDVAAGKILANQLSHFLGESLRRFRDAERKGSYEEEHIFPDVLLIDGGKGQLNAAMEVFKMLGREPPILISLAKREEEIFRPGDSEPIRLSRHAAALRLLQYVRDEAHRFAQHYHHLLRRKKFEE